ncbi:polyprenyl synthetase family protein [Candidatus Omnitrophota bacterium]
MNIKRYLINKKNIIDKALDKYLPSSKTKPAVIHKAMRYAVLPGGKRIRPILTIASFEACGGKGNAIMPVACAIELIHTYTLIHDDLPCMDNDDYRRGKLSCHKKFNEAIALLAGDALLTMGFELIGKSDIVKEVSKAIGSQGTIGGQVVDIKKTGHGSRVTGNDLDYIASHKTGALFEVAVKTAGIFKGVDEKKLIALSKFGSDIGFIFQLIDDLIDKDGYVKAYGAPHVKKMTELLTRRAKAHLDVFGEKAKILQGIADIILKRHD